MSIRHKVRTDRRRLCHVRVRVAAVIWRPFGSPKAVASIRGVSVILVEEPAKSGYPRAAWGGATGDSGHTSYRLTRRLGQTRTSSL